MDTIPRFSDSFFLHRSQNRLFENKTQNDKVQDQPRSRGQANLGTPHQWARYQSHQGQAGGRNRNRTQEEVPHVQPGPVRHQEAGTGPTPRQGAPVHARGRDYLWELGEGCVMAPCATRPTSPTNPSAPTASRSPRWSATSGRTSACTVALIMTVVCRAAAMQLGSGLPSGSIRGSYGLTNLDSEGSA